MHLSSSNNRRKFIKETAMGAAAFGLGITGLSSFLEEPVQLEMPVVPGSFAGSFDQQPLPYAYNALEDVIDSLTMEIHYSKHAAAYSKNLKEAATAEGIESSKTLEQILPKISRYSAKLRNNAGGHYNHEMFWQSMRPKTENNMPAGKLLEAIETSFSGFAGFKDKFSEVAKNRFGSGWAWLFIDANKGMKIGSTANQDNPLMDISDVKGFPLLAIDVWEHAYYLKYQNKRAEYIENWWKVVNWEYVQQRFEKI